MGAPRTASSQVSWSLLTEGVTAARVDLHRIRLLVQRASSLVEESDAKEHLYQVAGDIISGLPDRISAAETSLDRTAYALSVMGEGFFRARLPLSDRVRVEEAEVTAPYSGRAKESLLSSRVAARYLESEDAGARLALFREAVLSDLGNLRALHSADTRPELAWDGGFLVLNFRAAGLAVTLEAPPEGGYDRPREYRVQVISGGGGAPFRVESGGARAPDLRGYIRGLLAGREKAANSAEHHFHDNPQKREVREFAQSGALANNPAEAAAAAQAADNPTTSPGQARELAREAPPTPRETVKEPGGKQFKTLNRFVVETDQPNTRGLPRSRDQLPRHPILKSGGSK